MTYAIVATNKFKADLKLMEKRNYNLSKLDYVINELIENRPLPAKYRNHPLKGNYKGTMECHIEPDWLLIYAYDHESLILYEIRTGTHSDLYSRNVKPKHWWSRRNRINDRLRRSAMIFVPSD